MRAVKLMSSGSSASASRQTAIAPSASPPFSNRMAWWNVARGAAMPELPPSAINTGPRIQLSFSAAALASGSLLRS